MTTTTMTREELRAHLNGQIKVIQEKEAKLFSAESIREDIVMDPNPLFDVKQTIDEVDPDMPLSKKKTPTAKQAIVIKDIKAWYHGSYGYSVYEFAGFAGVGKSTVVDIILEEIALNPDKVRLCAPTGTASLVLKEKTPGFNCSTLHKLFYTHEILKDGRTRFVPTSENLYGVKLVVIDESSMVGKRIANEILPMARRAGCKVLVVGDPGQLPPVKDEEYFFSNPDSFLDEVLRQAADNPLIALSMAIREATKKGFAYRFSNKDQNIGGKVFLYSRSKITISQYAKVVANGGVVIAGTNRTRQGLNQGIREFLGYDEPTLMNGEKVVIKENVDGDDNAEIPVTNGMRGTVSKVKRDPSGLIRFKFTPDSFSGFRYIEVHEDILFERKTVRDMKIENKERVARGQSEIRLGIEAQLGYVITGHGSQGSQWNTVYVIDESGVFNRGVDGYKTQNRWLYTAVTRAVENLVVIR